MAEDDIQEAKTPDQIWEDDLLGRREEAEFLIRFIDGVVANPGPGREGQGFTIGIDAGYGEGKTFFLTRLEQHLKIDHSVAFIDAWADDLADQPLAALLATLKSAIEPKLKNKIIRDRWNSFLKKGGEVAKIAALGAMKRGLGLVITNAMVGSLGKVISNPSEDFKARTADATQNLTLDVLDGTAAQLNLSHPMDAKIKDFNEGKAALEAAKASLADLAKSLGNKKPIVIIIDELDRCRPTYAIKLLEEIKHMFDVQGVVFIFGLYADQLGHSVRGAYGPTFDGHAYLQRFINRRYNLGSNKKIEFICAHLEKLKIPQLKIRHLDRGRNLGENHNITCDLSSIIRNYADIFSLSARDIEQIISHIEDSTRSYESHFIILEYYLPLLVAFIKSIEIGELWRLSKDSSWEFLVDHPNKTYLSPREIFNKYQNLINCSQSELDNIYDNNVKINRESGSGYSGVSDIMLENFERSNQNNPNNSLTRMSNYINLINNLSRLQ